MAASGGKKKKKPVWTATKQGPREDVTVFFNAMKSFRMDKSELKRCTLCNTNTDQHKMRYKLLSCASSACQGSSQHDIDQGNPANQSESGAGWLAPDPRVPSWDWNMLVGGSASRFVQTPDPAIAVAGAGRALGSPPDAAAVKACLWRGRARFCEGSGFSMLEEDEHHLTTVPSPKGNRLTRELRSKAIKLAEQDMMPARVRNHLIEDLKLAADEIPNLLAVQNCFQYHRRRHMGNNDEVNTEVEFTQRHLLTAATAPSDTIAFGYDPDEFGNPKFGIGSDEDPFLIGLTTVSMLGSLSQDPQRFILHVDATFKLNLSGFPVLVFGTTGLSRRLKPVAFFVVSQRTERDYAAAIRLLKTIYFNVHKKPMVVQYVMGDADDAQYNAVTSELPDEQPVIYLMCFYHVLAKVQERTRALSKQMRQDVYRRVYDIHFARSANEQDTAVKTALDEWYRNPMLRVFADYFYDRWLSGRYHRWQCYHTPIGFAKTNNPVEQFNKVIKRDFTLRARLMVGSLSKKLSSCCLVQSIPLPDVKKTHDQSKLLKRTNILKRAGKLGHQIVSQLIYDYGTGQHVVVKNLHVRSLRSRDIVGVTAGSSVLTNEEKLLLQRTVSWNQARMEWEDQPVCGWFVNVDARYWQCRYFFKFGLRVHLIYALMIMHRPMPWDPSTPIKFVNRSVRKKTSGRDPLIGHGLSLQ